jgi:hypothetical protein
MSKLSRRRLLEGAFGAAQVGLLGASGLLSSRPARAQDRIFPSRLLSVWIDGGCHWETMFAPFTRTGIEKYIPGPTGGLHPFGYTPAQVQRYDRGAVDLDAPGTVRPLQGPVFWNWDDPGATTGVVPGSDGAQQFRPHGYAFADPNHRIYEKTCVLVGADQGTASHQSGIVASMSGVAGATFRSPAVQAVIANAMFARFPDRPLLNVVLGGPSPVGLSLPAQASPVSMSTLDAVTPTLSQRRDSAWAGLRTRSDTADVDVRGIDRGGVVARTRIDDAVARLTRGLNGRTSAGTAQSIETLYENTRNHSLTMARDVLSRLEGTAGFTHLADDPLYQRTTACIGSADACGELPSTAPWDFALRLLKSELVTSVSLRATSIGNFSFDTHFNGGPQVGNNHLRICFEAIGRMLIEMQLTDIGGGRSLLDDTLVYIHSDFGRTFPKTGSDHHPATCALLVGGNVRGNQMLGAYDETMAGSPLGAPVALTSEDGAAERRMPQAQDVAATVIRAFGLEPGRDFFIPGGYGIFDGALLA